MITAVLAAILGPIANMNHVVLAAIFGVVAAPFVIIPPLVVTLIIELPIAVLFRVGERGEKAVLLVNLVTNPLFSAVLFVLYGLGIGIYQTPVPGTRFGPPPMQTHVTSAYWIAWVGMEVAIALIEWGLLVWALQRTAGSARKLLAMSVCMNGASALIGLVWFLVVASYPV